ncbi:hypothetical protein [Limosilactobacillus sp.]|uniref:hypothetical protein n=1 Tax=Limosilactobacillus sp. TaxID=2773925 RepID=UPI003F066DFE
MDRIKNRVADIKQLLHSVQQLQANVKELQESLPAVTEFQNEVQRALDQWHFKSQSRIDKIMGLIDDLNHHNKD